MDVLALGQFVRNECSIGSSCFRPVSYRARSRARTASSRSGVQPTQFWGPSDLSVVSYAVSGVRSRLLDRSGRISGDRSSLTGNDDPARRAMIPFDPIVVKRGRIERRPPSPAAHPIGEPARRSDCRPRESKTLVRTEQGSRPNEVPDRAHRVPVPIGG